MKSSTHTMCSTSNLYKMETSLPKDVLQLQHSRQSTTNLETLQSAAIHRHHVLQTCNSQNPFEFRYLSNRKQVLASCLTTLASAIPYPPSATEVPAAFPHHVPHFGNKHGNFMPGNTTKASKRTTGGTVENPSLATFNININDGIGAGSDSYTMYLGDGSQGNGWPTRANWVSFVDMQVSLPL